MKKQKGFTLIELLVVIAVIGLLSSVVLISVRKSQKDAKQKKVMAFSSSIQHALGASALGAWSFEDNLNDSGGNNNGTWFPAGGSPVYTKGAVNKALEFDGGHYVYIPESKELVSKSGAITMEFWAKQTLVDSTMEYFILHIGTSPYNVFYCYTNSSIFYCSIMTGPPYRSAYFSIPGGIELNEWFHLVLTCDSKDLSSLKLYLNAEEFLPVSNMLVAGILGGGPVYIGGYESSESARLNGSMDEVRIYDSYISLSEVKKHYAEGLMRIGLAEHNNKNN